MPIEILRFTQDDNILHYEQMTKMEADDKKRDMVKTERIRMTDNIGIIKKKPHDDDGIKE